MCSTTQTSANFFFKQKTAYEILAWLEFRRVLFRSGAGRLINVMEDLGLGTKATRPNIIQNLYDRGYVHDDPLVLTEKGVKARKSVVQGKSVDLGGRRIIKKKINAKCSSRRHGHPTP